MVFETYTIPVLVCYFARIVQCRVLVDDGWCRLQRVNEEHPEEEPE